MIGPTIAGSIPCPACRSLDVVLMDDPFSRKGYVKCSKCGEAYSFRLFDPDDPNLDAPSPERIFSEWKRNVSRRRKEAMMEFFDD